MKNYKYLLFLFIIAMLSNGCKKDCRDASNPDCENYDPCYGKKPVTAEIIMEQQLNFGGNTNYFQVEDSVFWRYCVRFSCPDKNAKRYTWILGSETLHERSFIRCFGGQPYGEYEVKLIIEKDPDLNCFPNDDGIDTIVKKFRMVNVCDFLVEGTFKGSWDSKKDEIYEISFNLYDAQYEEISCDEDIATKILISNFYNDSYNQVGSREFISNTYFKSGVLNKNVNPIKRFGFELKVNPKTLKCEIIQTETIYKDGVFTEFERDRFHGIKIK